MDGTADRSTLSSQFHSAARRLDNGVTALEDTLDRILGRSSEPTRDDTAVPAGLLGVLSNIEASIVRLEKANEQLADIG